MSQPSRGPTPTDSPGTPDRWFVLILVALDYLVLYAHRSMLGFLKKPLSDGLNLTPDEFGWLYPAFYLPYTLSQVAVGYLGDRLPRRTILLWSLSASVLALVGMGLATGFWQMVGLRVLLGVGQAASVPAIASALADSFTPRGRSRAVSTYLIPYTLGLIVAATYGGRVADTPVWHVSLGALGGPVLSVPGWRMALLLVAALGAVVGAIFWLFFREPPRSERAPSTTESLPFLESLAAILRVPAYRALVTAFALYSTAALAVQYWLPGYLEKRFLPDRLQEANFLATFWIQGGTILGLFVGGWWGDRWSRRSPAGRTAVQVLGLVAMTPTLMVIGSAELRWLTGPMLLYGLGIGLYQANLWTTAFEVVRPETRSTAIGFMNVASGVFSLPWNPLIGAYEKYGGSVGTALASMSVMLLVTLVIQLYSIRYLLPRDGRVPRPR